MATLTELAGDIATLQTNVVALTAAVSELSARIGSQTGGATETQLQPLEDALVSVNDAILTLTTAITQLLPVAA